MTNEEAVEILHRHSMITRVRDGVVQALEISTKDGKRLEEWVTIPMNKSRLYFWLGY